MVILNDTRCAGSWFSKNSYSSQKNRLETSIFCTVNIIVCLQLTLKCAVFFTLIKWFTEQCHCYSVPWRATPCVSTSEYSFATAGSCRADSLWAVSFMSSDRNGGHCHYRKEPLEEHIIVPWTKTFTNDLVFSVRKNIACSGNIVVEILCCWKSIIQGRTTSFLSFMLR